VTAAHRAVAVDGDRALACSTRGAEARPPLRVDAKQRIDRGPARDLVVGVLERLDRVDPEIRRRGECGSQGNRGVRVLALTDDADAY
jgi:hypothetical protein